MATIGTFTAGKDGYAGTIRTLTISVKARIVANEARKSDAAPDFRVYAGRAELGAAWKARTSGDNPRDYRYLRPASASAKSVLVTVRLRGFSSSFLVFGDPPLGLFHRVSSGHGGTAFRQLMVWWLADMCCECLSPSVCLFIGPAVNEGVHILTAQPTLEHHAGQSAVFTDGLSDTRRKRHQYTQAPSSLHLCRHQGRLL